jgi:hypothetical protein
MRRILLVLVLPLSLGGCFSYSDSPQPQHTTIVVPPGGAAVVTCPNGGAPPC